MRHFLSCTLLFVSSIFYGQFGQKLDLSTVTDEANSTQLTDLDLDGDLDVVFCALTSDIILWIENLGVNGFGTPHVVSTAVNGPMSVIAADLDGDGFPDIVSASSVDHKIAWYKNSGNKSFSSQNVITTVANVAYCIYAADADGDSDLDIFSASNGDNKLAWYQNNGSGIFGSQQIISTAGNGIRSVFCIDLDEDGDIDALTASFNDDKISWYQNSGTGTFGLPQIITTLTDGAQYAYAFDVNGDGDNDVITASYNDDEIAWHENLGAGTFGPHQVLTASADGAEMLTAADFDGDSDLDLIALSGIDDEIMWYQNLGGTFGLPVLLTSQSNYPEWVSIGDVDNDLDMDLVVAASNTGYLSLYKNTGSATVSAGVVISPVADGARGVCASDLDLDGDMDVVSGSFQNDAIVFYKNLGDNNFATSVITNLANGANSVTIADIDGDGLDDVLSASYFDDKIAWYQNLGGGIFGAQQVITVTANGAWDVYTSDLDNDGDLDVLSASELDDKIAWYQNNGSGVFGAAIVITNTADYATSVYSSDLDSDGDLDVLSSSAFDDKVAWYENNGSGVFGPVQVITTLADYCWSVYADDMDLDGDIDVLSASAWDNKIAWYQNDGTGSFGPQQIISTDPFNVWKVITADIDNDNDPDVISSVYGDDKIVWHENLGAGTFGPQQTLPYFIEGPWGIMVIDMDGDADLDLLSASEYDDKVTIYTNSYYSETQIHGRLFIDINQNFVHDAMDVGLNQIPVLSTPASNYTFSFTDGNYFMNFSDTAGSYIIAPGPLANWSIVTDSMNYHVLVDTLFSSLDSLDFGFYPDTLIDSIHVELTAAAFQCNDTINCWINLTNTGTTIPSGLIHLTLHDSIAFLGSAFIPDSIIGQNIYWHYDSLFYFEELIMNLKVLAPDFNSMGIFAESTVFATIIDSLGDTTNVSLDDIGEFLTCAYDPNYKSVEPKGFGLPGYIFPETPELEYTIHFQNTGNDTAVNVVVTDQLDVSLDWQSIVPLASSYPMYVSVNQFGKVYFTFTNIMLPDSNINEPASHGFVKFKINLLSNLPAGTEITNNADIYFDQNPAVITNYTTNTIFECNEQVFNDLPAAVSECVQTNINLEITDFDGYMQFEWILEDIDTISGAQFSWLADTSGTFQLNVSGQSDYCTQDTVIAIVVSPLPIIDLTSNPNSICISSSPIIVQASPAGGIFFGPGIVGNEFDPALAGMGTHTFFYFYTDFNNCEATDSVQLNVIDCLGLSESNPNLLRVYPNPFSDFTTIYFTENSEQTKMIRIYDLSGRAVYKRDDVIGNAINIYRDNLEAGTYILYVGFDSSNEKFYYTKLVIE